jgi:ABC-2 type transport system permease protein
MAMTNACAQLIERPILFTQYSSTSLWLAQFIAIGTPLLLLGSSGLVFLYGILALPLTGSLALLILGQLATLLALFLIAAVISMAVKDNVRAISLCAALFAPAFAFMGVTFPSSDMPLAALVWRDMMPSTHFMQILLDQLSRQASANDVISLCHFLFFFGLAIPLLFLSRRYRADSIMALSQPDSTNVLGESR